jgi:hypothetical protein
MEEKKQNGITGSKAQKRKTPLKEAKQEQKKQQGRLKSKQGRSLDSKGILLFRKKLYES